MESQIVFRDESFEEITRSEIAAGSQALERVVAEWNKLGFSKVGSASEMYDLVYQDSLMYNEAVRATTRQSDDTNQPHPAPLKPADPMAFMQAAEAARAISYVAREYGIYTIQKGKVVIDQAIADEYIGNRSVTAYTEEQLAFFNDYEAMIRCFNTLNGVQDGALTSVHKNREVFGQLMNLPPEKYDSYPAMMKIDVLRETLERI